MTLLPKDLPPSDDKDGDGWTWLYNSPKWHCFRGARSLCGKYLLFIRDDMEKDDKFGNPKNCKMCEKKRKKELETTK